MHKLELKIPPVALAIVIAIAMWDISWLTQPVDLPWMIRATAAAIFMLSGACISIAGVVSFRRARTTVNPTKPDSTSSLVSSGIYSVTRNPMYLGFLLILIGWAVFLSNPFSLIGTAVFVLYMNRFQIIPEERVLSGMFGDDFTKYKAKVRRWV